MSRVIDHLHDCTILLATGELLVVQQRYVGGPVILQFRYARPDHIAGLDLIHTMKLRSSFFLPQVIVENQDARHT